MEGDDFDDVPSSVHDDDPTDRDDDGSDARSSADQEEEGDDVEAEFDMGARVGRLSRAELADKPPEGQLAVWQETLFSVEVDLVTELDATNLFFIHVESVIFDLIASKEVAFEEDTQFLSLTYAIEQLLSRIRAAGGVFRLVFFDCSKKLLNAAFNSSVWAFRQAFLVHCRSSNIDSAVFPHWYSREWKDHVNEWRPSFFLVANDTVELEEDEEDEDVPKLRGFFHALMLRCLSAKTHVALLRGLQFRGSRIMAFSLSPDDYESYVDNVVQAPYEELFTRSDEDEEEGEEGGEDAEATLASLRAFAERAGDKVEPSALLRSFTSIRFVKSTLAKMAAGQTPQTVAMMQVVVKVLLLQEMLLRQIPLDKRSYATCGASDWELFSKSIAGGLDRYFTSCAQDLSMLLQLPVPEGLTLETCDLFDGRFYRHVFHFVIDAGIKKGKVEAAQFGFNDFVTKELDFLWSEAGSKDAFFPIITAPLADLPGIQPPALPPKVAQRDVPQLSTITSDFVEALQLEVKQVELVPPEAALQEPIWDQPYNWKPGTFLDEVKETEHMDDAKFKALEAKVVGTKGGADARGAEFLRKYQLKKKQLGLRALSEYAKSLSGSNTLHHPIIMHDAKAGATSSAAEAAATSSSAAAAAEEDGEDGENAAAPQKDGGKAKGRGKPEKKEEKQSTKVLEMIKAREKAEEDKIKAKDEEKLSKPDWQGKIDSLEQILDPEKLEKEVLDLLLNFNRVTDSFVGFPLVAAVFKTSEVQCKVVLKVVKAMRIAMKKMQPDVMLLEAQPQVRRLVRYFLCILQEAFNSFGTKEFFDGQSIKLLQESLISVGFHKTAEVMFHKWKDAKLKAAGDAAGEGKGGGKDDKKKGKDDKKEKEKEKKDKKDEKDKKGDKDKKSKKDDKEDDDGDLDANLVKKGKVETIWSGVGQDEFSFQLRYMGPYMTRVSGTAKDKRVNFKPDGWQRDLLDIVDDGKSALIVAPTASGKTFIGYYVMDKVLRTDNEGIAVYVSPSKALVNQVSAEIFARFGSKVYPPHSKNELLGVFLQEFNSAGGAFEQGRWKNCQVLVTIPHILEMLILSPTNQDWVKRLKWVVFDEVHCIGNGEEGLQWEHCMQTIPCPFLALSATVAAPEHFHGWLQKVNAKKGHKPVDIVMYTERWNDLYKYVYTNGELRPLHPFCCLVEQAVRKHGMSSDLTLTPQEMELLWQEVSRIVGPVPKWDDLAPHKYFTGRCGFMTKPEARGYEKVLKATFLELVHGGELTSAGFSQLMYSLQLPADRVFERVAAFAPPARTSSTATGADAEDGAEEAGRPLRDLTKMVKSNGYRQPPTLLSLCKNLEKIQMLPAIVFNFDRKQLTSMVKGLVKELKDRQHEKYYGSEEAKIRTRKIDEKRMADYQKRKSDWEKAKRANETKKQEGKASRKAAGGGGGDAGGGEGGGEKTGGRGDKGAVKDEVAVVERDIGPEPIEPGNIADEIDMEFSFHNPKVLGQFQDEIEEDFQELWERKLDKELVDALRRGIGLHHEACSTLYKQKVEILFRRGFLKVVFATGTLALGINMPCRTTIFCGDSLELTSLMFRQMSGRAGRRGFDLLGQVVFLDMGFLKVRSLVASDLSTLTGEFMLSPTTLLRAFQQWERVSLDQAVGNAVARSKKEIARCLAPMFSLPFFRSGKADLETQIIYHTRFSVDFLYREGLLAKDGDTRGLANLSTYLFEAEPANLLLVRLLSKGLIHSYLKEEKKNVKKGDRRTHLTVRLVAVLAWLFYRKRLPGTLPKERPQRKKFIPSADCPRLPPLPPAIASEVLEYNNQVLEHMQQLAWTVASTRKIAEGDLELPLSCKTFRSGWDPRGEPMERKSEMAARIIKQMTRYRARSPFSALSGSGDVFRSKADLVGSARTVLHLDFNSFPTLADTMHGEEGFEPSNSWMLDFMIHGKISILWEDNQLDPTRAYRLIEHFFKAIKKAHRAIKVYTVNPKDIVLETFQELEKEVGKAFKAAQGRN